MKRTLYIVLMLLLSISVFAKSELKTFETDVDIIIKEETNSSSANVTIRTEGWNKTYNCNDDGNYEKTIEIKRNVSITDETCDTMLEACSDIGYQYSILLPHIANFNYSERWGICNSLKAEYKTKWENCVDDSDYYQGIYNNCTEEINEKHEEIKQKEDEVTVCIRQKNERITEKECDDKIKEEKSSNQFKYLIAVAIGFGICWFWKVRKPKAEGGGKGTSLHAI